MTDVDPKLVGAVEVVGRTGAKDVQIRYSDDEQPTVWFAVANYGDGRWETDAGRCPVEAVLRLCERLIDGGICVHCDKPTAFDTSFDGAFLEASFCWWQWDPELTKFRRGCE